MHFREAQLVKLYHRIQRNTVQFHKVYYFISVSESLVLCTSRNLASGDLT